MFSILVYAVISVVLTYFTVFTFVEEGLAASNPLSTPFLAALSLVFIFATIGSMFEETVRAIKRK